MKRIALLLLALTLSMYSLDKPSGALKARLLTESRPESEEIPFTPVYDLCSNMHIPADAVEARSEAMEFPAVPVPKGMAVVLKVNQRIVTARHGGWNNYFAMNLNGDDVQSTSFNGFPRLMFRGNILHTTHPSETEKPYWRQGSHPFLISFFAPADSEDMDPRVTDSQFGYDFYIDIDDIVSKLVVGADDRVENDRPNRLVFIDGLSKNIVNTSMFIKKAQIGYVPTERMNEFLGIKMYSYKSIEAPAAIIRGRDFKLNVSQSGGMELVMPKGRVFFESYFSYPHSPSMQFNTFGLESAKGEAEISANVRPDGTALFRTKSLSIRRRIASKGHFIRVIDEITNVSQKDLGLIWKNNAGYSGELPSVWRISGITGATTFTKLGAPNPTIYMSNGKCAVGIIAEDTVSRNLIDMHLEGNELSMGSQGVGIEAGKTLAIEWTIYPLPENALGYFDFINQVREDWGVNNTIPGPFHFSSSNISGLNLQFSFIDPWHFYSNGWNMTDEEYVKVVSGKAKDLRTRFPGIKLLGKVETNLVPIKVTDYEWSKQLPLTKGNRQDSKTKYAQYMSPELSKLFVAVTPYSDSMLRNAQGCVMFDNYYVYSNIDTINMMVQVETGNQRYKKFIEQVDLIMDKAGLNGVYIDQFNPTARDGIDYSKWDGYSVILDKTGNIKSKYYNFALTGAEGRMKIIKYIVDKGGIAFTNGHPVTREEQNSGRLSFAEMENDPCNPLGFMERKPPEAIYQAMGHLASPIILNLRPQRYTSQFPEDSPDMNARILTKGFIMAFRNGNIPYYYSTGSVPMEGPYAGSFELGNAILPFTPVKLGEGVLIGKERIITVLSGDYEMACPNKPKVTHFNKFGRPTDGSNIKVSGSAGNWKIHVTLDDWNEIAVVEVNSR